MRHSEWLACTECGEETNITSVPSTCPSCGGILDLRLPDNTQADRDPAPTSLWHWAHHLPYCSEENRISLGEAGSPLLACPRLARKMGVADLWIKNDSISPTASFKDRAIALATSLARQHQRKGLVLSSSGNAGASAAAYAARAGLPVVVLVPASAPEAKLRQIAATGARLVKVEGNTSDCCRLADKLARERDWVNLTTTYHNPYGVDAYATLAYEIAHLETDVLLLPISSGPLLGGIMKGFQRLLEAGHLATVPRPIAIQASRCAPIVQAFQSGSSVKPWEHQTTIASALNDTLAGYERDGDYTLSWIKRFKGAAFAVDDPDILQGLRDLSQMEGILAEPSGAVPIAALGQLRRKGLVKENDRIVAVVTGHGLKDLSWVDVAIDAAPIKADFSALARLVDQPSPMAG